MPSVAQNICDINYDSKCSGRDSNLKEAIALIAYAQTKYFQQVLGFEAWLRLTNYIATQNGSLPEKLWGERIKGALEQ